MKKFVFKLEKTRAKKLDKIRNKNGCKRNLPPIIIALILAKEKSKKENLTSN